MDFTEQVLTDEKRKIRLVSFNCKTIKTCALIIDKLIQSNDIILIQKHWLFQAQIHLFSEIHGEINYAGKGVDKYDPLLPVRMPRGYGGVAIIWRKDIDHIIRPYGGAGGLDALKKNGSELRHLSCLLSFSVDVSYHGGLVVVC
jgi:exonuclease III